MTARCKECRDGEHDDYDDDVVMTTVKDPDTGRTVRRCLMCANHRMIYLDDGYIVNGFMAGSP